MGVHLGEIMAGDTGSLNLGGSWTSGIKPPPIAPTSMFGNPNTFTAAANQQASDYDSIMKSYGDIIKSSTNNPFVPTALTPNNASFNPLNSENSSLTPQLGRYNQSNDVTNSLSRLSDLATNGGYDAAGIADLRARGIAPTRSIYANAQQNIERQRALGGGYSPNFNATQAQLARDESAQIGDINTNVNAGIAQNVASNRIAAAPSYASASANANAAQTESDRHNADIVNQINQFNVQNKTNNDRYNAEGMNRINEINAAGTNRVNELNAAAITDANKFNRSNTLGAVQGQASLYGTTPALTNTFGNQVVQAAQTNQNQQQIDQQKYNNLFNQPRFG